MDNLKSAALVFNGLLAVKYKIILGKRGNLTEFSIGFEKEDFFHLIGLQYLRDIPQLKKNRGIIFDKIISGEITESLISKSSFYEDIRQRIIDFIAFEELLDSNELVFKYARNRATFSNILAEYLLKTRYNCRTSYIFLDRSNDRSDKFCRSFFFNENNNYTLNQIAMTLLYKEKVLANGESIIQLDKIKKK